MKFPSVQHLYRGLATVIKRFPLAFIFILIATVCWCYYIRIGYDYSDSSLRESLTSFLIRGISVANLGLTLTLALDLLAEKRKYSTPKKWINRLVAALVCTALFFLLNPEDHLADVYRLALLAFSFHLFVAFSPFMDKGGINGFWQFNKVLFLRFLTAALYSAALFAGLAMALVAIDGLFSVEIKWRVYMTVFAIITAGFSPIFFLAGVPREFEQLNEDASYPKGLKIFTQFVLIPLMTIYLAILFFYEIKIIVAWQLPKGLVSSLIIGYAVFGILSLLLIYPMKEKEGNSWIKLFSRFFYIMLLPLVLLLLLAVWKRVGPYGITESRYILALLALWLTGITFYFLYSKKQNIKLIPISLAILSLLAVYGPQSASGLSRYSQFARLKKVLKSGKKEDIAERPSIIRYLVSRHGLLVLQDLTPVNLSKIEQDINSKNLYRYAKESVKVDSAFSVFKVDENSEYKPEIQYTFSSPSGQFIGINGFDYMMMFNGYQTVEDQVFEGLKIKVERENDDANLTITIGDKEKLEVDIVKVFDESVALATGNKLKPGKNKNDFILPADKMTFTKKIGNYQFTYIASQISGNAKRSTAGYRWINGNGALLIKKL